MSYHTMAVAWQAIIIGTLACMDSLKASDSVLHTTIDIIDYVTGIGNSSREQYIQLGPSVSP